MRTIFLTSLVLALSACGSSDPVPPSGEVTAGPASMRVMSYNIRYNNPDDDENAWPNRADRLAAQLRFNQPDVGGLQEVLVGQLNDLKTALPDYEFVGVGRDDGMEAGEFSPLLVRRDRLTIEHWDTFWLSETPDEVGSVGWDAALPRIVTWAQVRDRRDDTRFYVFNTHFDHQGVTAREQSALLIRRKIAELGGTLPFVVTGDFNVTPDTTAYASMMVGDTPVPVADALLIAQAPHHGPEETFFGFAACPSSFGFNDTEPRRIDYIFTHPQTRVLRTATLTDSYDCKYLSDHQAILADLRIERP